MTEDFISKTARKKQAKQVEELAGELVVLKPAILKQLPCPPEIRAEIAEARDLKGGARKRQLKYIAKQLRQLDLAPLLSFLEDRKGSRLREKRAFHELELYREAILDEALAAQEEAQAQDERIGLDWHSQTAAQAAVRFPGLDLNAVHLAARQFAITRRPVHRREIFRLLKAAMEQTRFSASEPSIEE